MCLVCSSRLCAGAFRCGCLGRVLVVAVLFLLLGLGLGLRLGCVGVGVGVVGAGLGRRDVRVLDLGRGDLVSL